MRIIETLRSIEDLKRLDTDALKGLANEIREIIIDRVSKNGGHLSSNLGIVELTIALHYVFDSPKDKILWDVGHQCYTHKLLTGRYKDFHTLRQHGGLSGFPRMSESPHDVFGTGHSSTSISAGLGMVVARDIINTPKTEDSSPERFIAVIGDGAMTSGLAFEGLNHAGHLKKDLIVILNDNEMSISPNVGALSNYLSRLQTGAFFKKIKRETKALLEGIPKIGGTVTRIAERAEGSIKGFFLPGGLFLDMGFNYLGPIDGHDIPLLIDTFKGLQDVSEPTLVHVVTTKGKGYKFSEEDPCIYHGIGPFDTCEGIKNGSIEPSQAISYSEVFGRSLLEIAIKDHRIVAITAAMKEGTGLSEFANTLPERFFDVGIAEPHAVTFAAGMATKGLRPVVAIYSTFLQRGYDEIIHDVCLQKLPVVFAIDRAGIVGEDGATHQGLFDIAYLRHIPNLTVMAPKNGHELKAMLAFAIDLQGPSAIRFPRGKTVVGPDDAYSPIGLIYGKSEIMAEGEDLLIIAVGNTVQRAMRALERLKHDGISATLINTRFIKPLDCQTITSLASKIKQVVTVEEHCLAGGFGSAVLECLSDNGIVDCRVKRLGIGDHFVEHGSQATLRSKYGLDDEGIYRAIIGFVKTNN